MNVKRLCGIGILFAALAAPSASRAAHPLITDDAGTQGKGNYQLEVNGQYDSDRETVSGASIKSTGGEAAATMSYGLNDRADLVLAVPYAWGTVTEGGVRVYDEQGLSDVSLEAKWRFYEREGFSFSVKPGISFPTGNDTKGLGTGKAGYHLFFIGSKEKEPWNVHANLGYIRNETRTDEEAKNLWHASVAATYEAFEDLELVGNIGIEKNPDKAADNDPAFLIAGAIYSVGENFDIDAGVKYGLTSPETDVAILAGTTLRF